MKAISIHQPWASMIYTGDKMIETRTWSTNYRGDLLICSSKKPAVRGLPCGFALCIVELYDCRPMTRVDEIRACCEIYPGAYAWCLRDIRKLIPTPVRGAQGLFEYRGDLEGYYGTDYAKRKIVNSK